MTEFHQVGALAALAALAFLVAAAGVAAWRDLAHAWIRGLALAATGLLAIVAGIGLLLLASGEAPREGLHLLYGAAVVAAVPIGLTFASEAPPRSRSGVLAVVGVAALLLIWRLFSTG